MSLLAENTRRWNAMHIKPNFWSAATKFAHRALAHKAEYQAIALEISRRFNKHIPWWFIPLVHERECNRGVDNWNCNIGQGSPYNQKSRVIPYNGPFSSFQEAAIAALVHEAPHAASNTNWSGGGTMTIGEAYNGKKYANQGLPSPYVWSGTDQYKRGKVLVDHGPIEYTYPSGPNKGKPVVDTQLGIAISLKAMMELDPSIQLDGDMPGQDKTDRTKEVVNGTAGTGGIAEATHQALINGVDDWIVYTVAALAAVALIYWVYRIYRKKKGEV